jgi:hypothetical protein
MTGLVRKATLLGVCGLMAAATALANVPDPAHSTCPNWLFVVGRVNGGTNTDAVGLATVTVRDFANNPIANALVKIDFSGCCDINLCSAVVAGQTVDCANRRVTGFTNNVGVFQFTILGAAKDPGNIVPCAPPGNCIYGGCGLNGVSIVANAGTGDVKLCNVTAVCLDLNGAATPAGSNGTSIGDVANEFNLFGARALGQPYKGRGDFNCDGNITIADVAAEFGHFGRLAVIAGVGCTNTSGTPQAFCTKPACP